LAKPFSGVPQRDPKLERAARTEQATQDEKLLAAWLGLLVEFAHLATRDHVGRR